MTDGVRCRKKAYPEPGGQRCEQFSLWGEQMGGCRLYTATKSKCSDFMASLSQCLVTGVTDIGDGREEKMHLAASTLVFTGGCHVGGQSGNAGPELSGHPPCVFYHELKVFTASSRVCGPSMLQKDVLRKHS